MHSRPSHLAISTAFEHADHPAAPPALRLPQGVNELVLNAETKAAGLSVTQLADSVNRLMSSHRLRLLRDGTSLVYQEVPAEEAAKWVADRPWAAGGMDGGGEDSGGEGSGGEEEECRG